MWKTLADWLLAMVNMSRELAEHRGTIRQLEERLRNVREAVLLLVAVLGLAVATSACDSSIADAKWASTVPGTYIGQLGDFREVIVLHTNKTFNHTLHLAGTQLRNESGRWQFDVASGMIGASPFTSYYNTSLKRFSTNGIELMSTEIAVLRYGSVARVITESVDWEYCLRKE